MVIPKPVYETLPVLYVIAGIATGAVVLPLIVMTADAVVAIGLARDL